jgi:hypothetical protein
MTSLRSTLAALAAFLPALASVVLDACTDGTTPDCSGNPSPCGYDLPSEVDAASQADNGG